MPRDTPLSFHNGRESVRGNLGPYQGESGATFVGSAWSGSPLNGAVDDVRIYDRTLSEEEVLALYSFPEAAPPHADEEDFSFLSKQTMLAWDESVEKQTTASPQQSANEVLPKEILRLWEEARNGFNARMRAVRETSLLIDGIQSKIAELDVPEEPPPLSEGTEPKEAALVVREFARKRLSALKEWLSLIQGKKSLVETKAARLELAQTSVADYVHAMERLFLLIKEIEWRVADETLDQSKIPPGLSMDTLRKEKAELLWHKKKLKSDQELTQKELAAIAAAIPKVEELVAEAETQYAGARNKHARALKRHKLAEGFRQLDKEALQVLTREFEDQRIWLHGAFVIAHRQHEKSPTKVRELEENPVKGTGIQSDLPVQDDPHGEHLSRQAKALGELRTRSESHIAVVTALEKDAVALKAHLFKMVVLAEVVAEALRQDRLEADAIIPGFQLEAIVAAHNETGALSLRVAEELSRTRKRLTRIPQRIAAAEKALKRLEEDQITRQKDQDYASWKARLLVRIKSLDWPRIIAEFQRSQDELKAKKRALAAAKTRVEEARAGVRSSMANLEAIQSAQYRKAWHESLGKKIWILSTLRRYAGLVSEEKNRAETSAEGEREKLRPARKKPTATTLETFQKALLNLSEDLAGWQSETKKLQASITTMDQRAGEFATLSSEARILAETNRAYAGELKKRLGRKEQDDVFIPDGIAEALVQDFSVDIEKELCALESQQSLVQLEISSLVWRRESLEKYQVLISKTLQTVGERADLAQKQQELEQ